MGRYQGEFEGAIEEVFLTKLTLEFGVEAKAKVITAPEEVFKIPV